MLDTPRWKKLGSAWDSEKRHALVMAWHNANGLYTTILDSGNGHAWADIDALDFPGWPDSSKGIYGLKKKAIVAALSNGNVRFLVDLVRSPCATYRAPSQP